MNEYINNNINRFYYIWPCSIHTTTLFLFGLDYTKFKGILDNSPNKINKYIDGYNLLCGSFNELIKEENKKKYNNYNFWSKCLHKRIKFKYSS